jgi:hypothetical protein
MAKTTTKNAASDRGESGSLRAELRGFAASRPQGWNHDDWTALLTALSNRGHDVDDPERIGEALERERLASVLADVPGMGPRRIDALVTRFATLWRLSQADVAELVALRTIPRALAERTLDTVRQRAC